MVIANSAGGIVMNGELILVVQQRNGTWSLPKGHVEDGEEVFETAKREIFEESGVKDLHFIKPLGNYTRESTFWDNFKTLHMFLFHSSQKELNPIDPHNPLAKWAIHEEILGLLKYQQDKDFLTNALNEINK
jgi:8-oxo-dGTP pyrophosphatase MutT (NUDIX family)